MEINENLQKLLRNLTGTEVLVLGAGVTGLAICEFLTQANAKITLLDDNPIKINNPIKDLHYNDLEIIDNFKEIDITTFNKSHKFQFVVKSPGIPKTSKSYILASKLGIPIFSDLDLALPLIGMPDIAVTGTNGKTTTVMLLKKIYETAKKKSYVIGNLGIPFIRATNGKEIKSTLSNIQNNNYSLIFELSSYQLEDVTYLKPKISVCLNLSDDHLERHETIKKYALAKSKIYSFQTDSDWSVIFEDEKNMNYFTDSLAGTVFKISEYKNKSKIPVNNSMYDLEDKKIYFRTEEKEVTVDISKSKILGIHNYKNIAAAVTLSLLDNIPTDAIEKAIAEFTGLEHRIEFVRNHRGIIYYNDSKSTCPHSVVAALETIKQEHKGSNIVLLLGGILKKGDWISVNNELSKEINEVVCFGKDNCQILEHIKATLEAKGIKYKLKNTLLEATMYAKSVANSGDIILLSPGCTSFDEFDNFEHRGKFFKDLITRFKE